ncbi:hypothetical protein PP178_04005 [Zeaxanthinibacter sp. PT1]|uniref:hypothetical protein n=1 Tax=Zeaxanthinibacter TaxID=561554 RepID=UPI00234A0C3C|nr:hypothetical protein [Zeaxanthinibacter sp. PT1]MDC6350704.1 hypothetical protein [Zeaxanthinibacter sp. PT1]
MQTYAKIAEALAKKELKYQKMMNDASSEREKNAAQLMLERVTEAKASLMADNQSAADVQTQKSYAKGGYVKYDDGGEVDPIKELMKKAKDTIMNKPNVKPQVIISDLQAQFPGIRPEVIQGAYDKYKHEAVEGTITPQGISTKGTKGAAPYYGERPGQAKAATAAAQGPRMMKEMTVNDRTYPHQETLPIIHPSNPYTNNRSAWETGPQIINDGYPQQGGPIQSQMYQPNPLTQGAYGSNPGTGEYSIWDRLKDMGKSTLDYLNNTIGNSSTDNPNFDKSAWQRRQDEAKKYGPDTVRITPDGRAHTQTSGYNIDPNRPEHQGVPAGYEATNQENIYPQNAGSIFDYGIPGAVAAKNTTAAKPATASAKKAGGTKASGTAAAKASTTTVPTGADFTPKVNLPGSMSYSDWQAGPDLESDPVKAALAQDPAANAPDNKFWQRPNYGNKIMDMAGMAAPFADNVAFSKYLDKVKPDAMPHLYGAPQMNTNYNIEPQLADAKRGQRAVNKALDQSNASRGASNANKVGAFAARMGHVGQLHAQKENAENQMKNRKALIGNRIANQNANLMTQHGQNMVDFHNQKGYNKYLNVLNMTEDFGNINGQRLERDRQNQMLEILKPYLDRYGQYTKYVNMYGPQTQQLK